jgi:hypothetical protein
MNRTALDSVAWFGDERRRPILLQPFAIGPAPADVGLRVRATFAIDATTTVARETFVEFVRNTTAASDLRIQEWADGFLASRSDEPSEPDLRLDQPAQYFEATIEAPLRLGVFAKTLIERMGPSDSFETSTANGGVAVRADGWQIILLAEEKSGRSTALERGVHTITANAWDWVSMSVWGRDLARARNELGSDLTILGVGPDPASGPVVGDDRTGQSVC